MVTYKFKTCVVKSDFTNSKMNPAKIVHHFKKDKHKYCFPIEYILKFIYLTMQLICMYNLIAFQKVEHLGM